MYIENKHLFEDIDSPYNQYLEDHIGNVQRGYEWFKENLPEILDEDNYIDESMYFGELDEIIEQHDSSKYNDTPSTAKYYDLACEWDAYNDYFYGTRTPDVEKAFDYAWLSHIHNNPHHWQHWLLQNDDPEIGLRILDMPYVFIIEMICDWWSFSWKSDNLYEIFEWYEKNKAGIKLSDKSRTICESILAKMRQTLDSLLKTEIADE